MAVGVGTEPLQVVAQAGVDREMGSQLPVVLDVKTVLAGDVARDVVIRTPLPVLVGSPSRKSANAMPEFSPAGSIVPYVLAVV